MQFIVTGALVEAVSLLDQREASIAIPIQKRDPKGIKLGGLRKRPGIFKGGKRKKKFGGILGKILKNGIGNVAEGAAEAAGEQLVYGIANAAQDDDEYEYEE